MKKFFLLLCFILITEIYYAQTSCAGVPTVNYSNKTYHTVQIGNQCWLKENIDVGTMISGAIDQSNNGIIEKYCYNDDPSMCEKYGGLYTWDEAMKFSASGDQVQGLCPSGWRLPALSEFNDLQSFVKNDGGALKDTAQSFGSVLCTNTSGFTALLAGARGAIRSNGSYFSHVKVYSLMWSSTEYNADYSYVMDLSYSSNMINIYGNGKLAAFSLRCLKGEGTVDVSENKGTSNIPSEFALYQNYPNPFNPTTTIKFDLPKAGNTKLAVFDITGKEVEIIVNKFLNPGSYNFDFNASGLASGIYLYKIVSGDFIKANKMLLIK